jgi:heterodisulfide reductase subunit C
MRENYSPIEIVRGVLLGLKDMVLSSDVIWRCLSCKACTDICPAGIKFSDFIESIRKVVMDKGVVQYVLRCKRCGRIFTTTPILELVEKMLPKEVKLDEEYLMLCPNCKPYALLNKSARWYGKGIVEEELGIRHG